MFTWDVIPALAISRYVADFMERGCVSRDVKRVSIFAGTIRCYGILKIADPFIHF